MEELDMFTSLQLKKLKEELRDKSSEKIIRIKQDIEIQLKRLCKKDS